MASDWLNHKELAIIKGIGKTPTDSLSAEPDPIIFNCMGGISTLGEWTPNIPGLKNGGVWADSPITDGRQLLSAPVSNVTEKMELVFVSSSYKELMTTVSQLGLLAVNCRDYWQTVAQIDPVYLKWLPICGGVVSPGPQYVLLYNIEVAWEFKASDRPTIIATVTLEREPYWRPLPPGANPKLWTFYVNNQAIGLGTKVLADATLISGSDHLITQTVNNKAEWTPAAYGLQSTFLSQNFMDISASQVPGDAPALVELAISAADPLADVYIAVNSKRQSGTGHDSVSRVNSLILNGGDGSVSVATKTAGSGVRSNGSAVTFYTVSRTSTGIDGAWQDFATWGTNAGTGLIRLDRNFFRGTFAVFCRCRNESAAAPVLTDMRIRIQIQQSENSANQYNTIFTLPEINPPVNNYALSYMGNITIPFESRAVQSLSGYGLQLQESNPNLIVKFQQRVDVATANRTLAMIDVIFIPFDEPLVQVALSGNSMGAGASNLILDNTGYLSRGELSQLAVSYMSTVLSGGIGQEIRGQGLYLQPRTNQRLYFINDAGVSPVSSSPNEDMTVRLNIMPRWTGIRDV